MKLKNPFKSLFFTTVIILCFFTVQTLQSFSMGAGLKTLKIKPKNGFGDDFNSPEIKTGKDLYFGDKTFKNGGQACVYCHNLKEATSWEREKLGPPLDEAVKDISKAKLIASLVNSHWLVMKTVYKDKPITESEAIDLVAYLEFIRKK